MMCGRYVLSQDWTKILEYFQIQSTPYATPPRYNIAPSQSGPAVLTGRQGERRIGPLQWGIVPSDWKNPDPKVKPINTRSEGLKTNPVFRRLLTTRRCLIPANAYIEWRKNDKQPFYIYIKNRPTFAFAGIFDHWTTQLGETFSTFAIITCAPKNNFRLGSIHDRMPVILRSKQDERFWLDRKVSKVEDLLTVLEPYPEDDMDWYPINKMIGNVSNDSAECVRPVAI